jgi:hypothetical protein
MNNLLETNPNIRSSIPETFEHLDDFLVARGVGAERT